MKRTFAILISAALVGVVGAVYFFSPPESPTQDSAAPPMAAVPLPDAVAGETPATSLETSGAEQARGQQIALGIERALAARDPKQRETAFAFLLPELIELQPERLTAMVARQEPGEARDALRDEVVRQWIVRDRDAAIAWMGSLENEAEREASATLAMRTLAATSPAQAIEVADQFGIGRDDGTLEHIVQIWATEKPDEALRWIDSQPAADPRTAQLRARIDLVRPR
jgi:hypothetical protein